jgi:ribose transport system ATP-binding protein
MFLSIWLALAQMNEGISRQEVVAARDVKVAFGAVKALDGVDLVIHTGECIGLVGHNGAGKSTIVNVINGGRSPHSGTLSYGNTSSVNGIAAAQAGGIRCVFQELSLCPNLTLAENIRVMHSDLKGFGWRKRAEKLLYAQLQAIFPGNHIDCSATVSELSIAERQMVEIAINFLSIQNRPKLVILDEPTSSLDAGLAEQLMAYIRKFIGEGGSVLLISHILGEILTTATRIVVMKDGKVVVDGAVDAFDNHSLVAAMGNVVKEEAWQRRSLPQDQAPVVTLPPRKGNGFALNAWKGEIIGLAGLGGHGQSDALLDIYLKANSSWFARKKMDIAFVAGDRALNGTFPLWSILNNLSIGPLRDLSNSAGMIDAGHEQELGASWKKRIEIRTPDMKNRILSLSGGNQQKVLFARALATSAATVLMDDPMRGVDIGTKQEVYEILRSEAANGRTFVWYSTEMDEIRLCDRVYIFRDGVIEAELIGDDITEQNILAASFAGGAH